jgi:hypothetical protein
MADWTKLLAWLQVGAPDNPYPFEVLDCRVACTCACRKSNPNIFVVQTAEDWAAKNTPCPLHGAR